MNLPAGLATLNRGRFKEFDELAESTRGFGLQWLQLDRGVLDASVIQISLAPMLLTRFSFNRRFHQSGSPPAGLKTFALLHRSSTPVHWRNDSCGYDRLVSFADDDDFQFVSDPGFCGDTISVPPEALRSTAETLGVPDPLESFPRGQGFHDIDPASNGAMRQLMDAAHMHARSGQASHPSHDRGLSASILCHLVRSLLGTRSSPTTATRSLARELALQRSLEFIAAHGSRELIVSDLCQVTGVSWRTLGYAFRDRFDMTPKQYLQAQRFQGVRSALRGADAGESVAEIARKWGFRNAGRFATQYRQRFGELPSQTLRR